MFKKILFVVSCMALVTAGPAFSQCADPDNMLSSDDCGFDTAASVADGTAWWNMVPEIAGDPLWGTVVHSATGGRTSPGTMVGTSYDNGPPPMGWGSLLGVRYCLTASVNPGDVLGFGAWINVTSGTANYCEIVLFTSSSPNCSAAADQVFHSNFAVAPAAWTKVNDNDTTLTATMAASSIEVRVACYANSEIIVSFDDAYIGLNMVPVELQSFSIE